MRRGLRATVLLVGAVATFGGGVAAWASWTTPASTGTTTVRAATIPVMAAPAATLSADKPVISWHPVAGDLADRYVVTRHDGTTACTVAARLTSCRDDSARHGDTFRYAVRATLGSRWEGPDSALSNAVTVPAGPKNAPDPSREQVLSRQQTQPSAVETTPTAGDRPGSDGPSFSATPSANLPNTDPSNAGTPRSDPSPAGPAGVTPTQPVAEEPSAGWADVPQ